MSTIVLVAFEVYADDMEDAQEQLMNKLLPTAPFPRRYTEWLDSWWIAMDERYDRSDLESAVFIPHGISQKDARDVLCHTSHARLEGWGS